MFLLWKKFIAVLNVLTFTLWLLMNFLLIKKWRWFFVNCFWFHVLFSVWMDFACYVWRCEWFHWLFCLHYSENALFVHKRKPSQPNHQKRCGQSGWYCRCWRYWQKSCVLQMLEIKKGKLSVLSAICGGLKACLWWDLEHVLNMFLWSSIISPFIFSIIVPKDNQL